MHGVRIARAVRRHGIRCRVAVLLLAGLPFLAPAPAAVAQGAPLPALVSARDLAAHVAEASRRFRIPESWIRAVLDAESARDIGAVSEAGAMGLMQVMPNTWTELAARYAFGNDPFDPRDNILAGTAYLREMLDRYGNIGAMLAAYNAGPGRYDEYLATARPLPAETRFYVAALAPLLGAEPLPDGTLASPSLLTDWREAPLFVAPAIGGSPVASLHPDGQSEAEATTEPARDEDAAALPPAGIFVARSRGSSPP